MTNDGKAMVTVMRCESDEMRARMAMTLHSDGIRPVLVHCTSSASADAVVRLLRARRNPPRAVVRSRLPRFSRAERRSIARAWSA
jgi:hypothetical protein